MRRRVLLAAPLALVAERAAWAHSYQLGHVEIGHPWSRPSVIDRAAVFLALSNIGRSTDRLAGGSTPIAQEALLPAEDAPPLQYLKLLPPHPLGLLPARKPIPLLTLK